MWESGSSNCFSKTRVIRILQPTSSLLLHLIQQQYNVEVGTRSVVPKKLLYTDFHRIASVAGTAEPVYGPEAFESVIARTKDKNPVSDLTPEDYEWTLPEQSHVETSTFYITADSGHAVMCQIIHSKVKYSRFDGYG